MRKVLRFTRRQNYGTKPWQTGKRRPIIQHMHYEATISETRYSTLYEHYCKM